MDAVDWRVHGGIAGCGAARGPQVAKVGVPDRRLDGIPQNLSSTLKSMGAVVTEALGSLFEGRLLLAQLLIKLINAFLQP